MIRTRLRSLRPDILIGLAYLILPFLLYAGVTVGSRTMLPADNLFQWPPWRAAAAQLGVGIPHNALISDLIIQNYAWKRFVLSSLTSGELPLWNPYLFAGAPFLANGQHAALYPFGLIFLVVPLAKAYGWFALSQVWLAGISMYVFGRVLGMRRGSAALAGFVYQGAQFLIISAAVFPMIAAAVVWLPFLLACVDRVVATADGSNGRNRATMLWAAAGALALGCQVLAGHAEFTYYTLLIMALYGVWRILVALFSSPPAQAIDKSARRKAPARYTTRAARLGGWLVAMVMTGLLIGSLQLVPLLEVGQVNFRAGSASYEEVRGWAYPPRNALIFLMPNFFGNPAHHRVRDAFTGQNNPLELNYFGEQNPYGANTTSWGTKNYVEGAAYMGILPLLLAAIGILTLVRWRRMGYARRSDTLFFAGLAFLSLAFIFGTPLYAILYYGLPFINQLHTPFRWVFPLALSVAVLAGFGADEWGAELRSREGGRTPERRSPSSVRGWAAAWPVVAPLAAGMIIITSVLSGRLFFTTARPLIDRLFHGLAGAEYAFPSAEVFFSYLFWQLLLLGGLLVGSGLVLWLARRTHWWIAAACGLIILDLFVAGAGFHASVDPALLDYTPAAVRWLNDQPGEWRITTFDTKGADTLKANTPWLHGLRDIRGYDSIIPRQFTDYMGAIEPQNRLQFNQIQPIGSLEALDSPLLDVLAVKYVVAAEPIPLPKFRAVWEGDGVTIYENLAVAPRAYVLPQTAEVRSRDVLATLTQYDPRNTVIIESDGSESPDPQPAALVAATVDSAGNNQIVVTASAAEPSWLVLSDSYFKGWRAYVRPAGSDEDAEIETQITRVNGNFRGVPLLQGDWTVRFRYSPRSFQLGGLMSFMGVIVLVFSLGVWAWGSFYRPNPNASTTHSVAKNSAAPMLLNLFNKGIDFVFAAFYLRVLGPAEAGSFATAIATAGLFEIVANYGLNILLIRDVSQDKSQAGQFLLNSSVLRLLTAAIASLPIIVYLVLASSGTNPLSLAEITAILLMMVGMFFSGLALGVSGLFYVHEEAEVPAAVSTVSTILKVGLGVAVLLAGFSFVGLSAVSIVVNVVTLALLLALALRRFDLHGPWSLDRAMLKGMLRLGFPLMLIHLLQTIFISIDVILLRQLLPDGERVVGWYNSAWKWFNALQIIPSYFTLALFPIISRAINENMDAARRMYRTSIKLMLLLALPIALLTTFAAPFLIRLLGGSEFLPQGAIALQIIIWSIPFGWMNSVTNYVLIALGLERMQPRAFAIAVGFNIICNYLFIPRFSFVAAGITTILSEVVLLIMFAYYLRQRGAGVDWLGLVSRPIFLALVMLAVMWLGYQVSFVLALVLGIIVYPVGLVVFRIIEPEERRAIVAIMPDGLAQRLWRGN